MNSEIYKTPDTKTDMLLAEEIRHLRFVSFKLREALQRAEESVQKLDREYMDSKRYMAENRGEIDPHEMFQTELLLKQTDRTGAFAVEIRNRIAKLEDSPYFARIDFQEKGGGAAEVYYIGPSSFSHENELLIFDWRAPIASMFYDCEVGPAAYQAPDDRVEGELSRKRQFKIRGGVMEYALETSAHVQDDILQRELSHTSDEKMKSIIATIQREQNQIIRNEKAETLVIQGVAGSGKTSIALHRIAYLLYRFKGRFSSNNVTILSPNRVFGDYISNVIPELGEEPIYELSFAELAQIQLEGVIGFKPDRDPLETTDDGWARRVQFKSTLAFVSLMDQYIEELPHTIFAPADYRFGHFTAEGDWIKRRFQAYRQYPVKRRLMLVAEDILERFQNENLMEDELPRLREIERNLTSMLAVKSSLALYKDFYKRMNLRELFIMPEKKTLEWADVYPFLYLRASYEGLKESGLTKHLVIDEMQDYTPIQYAALNLMFPCQKTILGDFGQSMNPNHQHSLEEIRQLYPKAEFVTLNKSYRSTFEIIQFAKRILDTAKLEAIERHGEEPAVITCTDKTDQIRNIQKAVLRFRNSPNASLGIIMKTNSAAIAMYETLSNDYEVSLITPESVSFQNGISITCVQMSKGLEFDEVIIPDADSSTYRTEHDRSLLYIACTRAMHRLILLYTEEPSRLLEK